MIKYIFKTDKLLSFILSVFVFILLVDPTNSILHLKGVVFAFLLALCALGCFRLKKYGLIIVFSIYFIVIYTFYFGYILDYNFDYNFTISVIKGFSPLILFLWIDKIKILKKMIFPSLIICFIVISTFIIFLYNKSMSYLIYKYFMQHDATMMISSRSFIGLNIMSFFYKSLPALILPSAIYAHRFFSKDKSTWIDFTIMSVFLLTLFLGGTRSCMLAGLLIILINSLIWLTRYNLGKLFVIPLITVIIVSFSVLFFSLVLDKKESSNMIKYATLNSYSELAIQHPSILLFGQGAGSSFYSDGRKEIVFQTEWSYLEIVRMFGLFGAFLVIGLFVTPLYLLYKKRQVLIYWFPIFLGYLFYLFVGGTNPLLLGSTGMLVLLAAYSYSLNPYYERYQW